MVNKRKILIVEGNTREENNEFTNVGIKTHTESLIDSINFYEKQIEIDVVNPSSDSNLKTITQNFKKYDGMIWGGSSLNIYNDTEEIRRQISFMRECQKKIKKIFAICWGLQVAVTVAGGEVKKSIKGAHRGIAYDIEINKNGYTHSIYCNKKSKFNSPAFNFDEVVTIPEKSKVLSSNKLNKVMGLHFKSDFSDIWGIQYHPEITYEKMVSLIHFRKNRLLNKGAFKDEDEINSHVMMIEDEIKNTEKKSRMKELENWLNYLYES
tara:strand:- start:10268 stop:11065 length:798 start_codon:yes stop_codon:yes gene_type:complete